MTLKLQDVVALAEAAGFTPSQARTMATIAYFESGLDPNAHNPNAGTGDNSYGLWQINMLGNMGPERRKAFNISDNEALFNPAVNAMAAKKIYEWQGFGAWSVYRKRLTNPKWQSIYNQTSGLTGKGYTAGGTIQPVLDIPGPFDDWWKKGYNKGKDAAGDVAGVIPDVADALNPLDEIAGFLRDSFIRFAYFMLGLFLIGLGLYKLATGGN